MPLLSPLIQKILQISPVQRQSFISLFWQITFTAIGFLSTIYFSRTVGASILGAYFLFQAYLGIFSTVSDGGFGGAAIKRISEGKESEAYFSAFTVLRTAFTISIVVILLFLRDHFVDLNESGMFFWLIMGLLISIPEGPINVGISGMGKMGISLTCSAFGNISRIIFQVIAVYLGYGAAGLAGGAIAGTVMIILTEFKFLELRFKRFGWRHLKSLAIFSFWIFLTSSGALVFTQADTIMIGYFMSNADVGVYKVVTQFTVAATFTTYAMRSTLWPRVSRWSSNDRLDLVEESLSKAITYSLLLAVPVFVGGVLLGDRLLPIYGAEFEGGYYALILLLAVQVVNVFQFLFTMYLDAMDHPKDSFKVTLVGVGANVLLNYIMIPIIGIEGAALATLITMALNAFLARRLLLRLIVVRIESSLYNISIASVIMGVVVGAYRLFVPYSDILSTLIAVAVGGMVYGALVLKLDCSIREELRKVAEGVGVRWPH